MPNPSQAKPLRVAVVGTGYVGLSTGLAMAHVGHQVTCVDIDAAKLERLRRGEVPFHEPHMQELLAAVRDRVAFTDDVAAAASEADAVFLAVNAPSRADGTVDLTQVDTAARGLARAFAASAGFTVVATRSTVPPGTAARIERVMRDEARASPAAAQRFAAASNPEFLREGSAVRDSLYPTRVVVGCASERGLQTLRAVLKPFVEQTFAPPAAVPRPPGLQPVPWIETDPGTAELSKYASNAFLATKVSFINEVAELAEAVGADVTRVAEIIGLDPRIGTKYLQAGIGWGGSCLGKDTVALVAAANAAGAPMGIVAAARAANERARQRVVDKLAAELGDLQGKTVTLLGLAFKPGTDDLRDAPALDIARRLLQRGANVRGHDPVAVPRARNDPAAAGIQLHDDLLKAVTGSHALVVCTDWPQYRQADWPSLAKAAAGALLLDGRNFLDGYLMDAAGWRIVGVGR